MNVIAPGKIILSGEYAVVHGHPALAMAVNRYVSVSIKTEDSALISLHLKDLAEERHHTLFELKNIREIIRNNYNQFQSGTLPIRDVLKESASLAQFTLSLFLEEAREPLLDGIKIEVQSTIPMNSGMGSSAATIVGLLFGLANHFTVSLSPDNLYRMGLEAENAQHGHSSGLDLQISLNGGCQYYKDRKLHNRMIPALSLFLANTGQPKASTGECLMRTFPYFKKTQIGQAFSDVTIELDKIVTDFSQNKLSTIKNLIRENHQLLVKIGAVPEKVQQFIREIEAADGAAKISGAGSVTGDEGGMVVILMADETHLNKICARYDYSMMHLLGEKRGVHVV